MTAERHEAQTEERRSPPVSIEQIPGFVTFKDWLMIQFSGLTDGVSGLRDDVTDIKKFLNEGNGKPSLREQVNLNTTFREDCQDTAKDVKKMKRNAMASLIVSLIILTLNVVLKVAGVF